MVYPASKQPFERLTTLDERVDYIHNQLSQSQVTLDRILELGGQEPVSSLTKTVSLPLSLLPLTGNQIEKPSPLTGRIIQIIPHWPDGCDALVDMAVGHGEATWIYPNQVDTFVALNDATPVLTVNEPIQKGERLWMIGRNGDGGNTHSINCAIVIVGVE